RHRSATPLKKRETREQGQEMYRSGADGCFRAKSGCYSRLCGGGASKAHAAMLENSTRVSYSMYRCGTLSTADAGLSTIDYFAPPASITFTCCRTLASWWPSPPRNVTRTSYVPEGRLRNSKVLV